MLSKLMEILYLKVYINIVVNKSSSIVYIEVCSKDEVIESVERTFDTITLDKKMFEFIDYYVKKTPYFYISLLDTSHIQGAVPTCSNNRVSEFIDINETNYICYEDSWTYYTSKSGLKDLQTIYAKIGLDYVLSPFVILNIFFKNKIDSYMGMYILIENNTVLITIFDNSTLLYGTCLEINHSSESDDLIIDDDLELEDDDENINLNDIDVLDDIDGLDSLDDMDSLDDIDSLDDFGDIEDLDSFDDINDFDDDKDIEEELIEELELGESDVSDKKNNSFTGDYHIFSIIQRAVNDFYQDKKYKSEFIESVYIADALGVSGDLKKFLEEEMFLSVYIRQINLPMELCTLAKMESK